MGDLEAAPDLAVCDREPITRLERIQPFGFLLAMTRNWTVARASENLSNFLGIEASAAIGASLDDILDRQTLHDIRNRMAFLGSGHGSERLYGLTLVAGRPPFDISVHYANSMIVLEGEPTGVEDRTDAASLVRAMVARLATQKTLEDFHRDAARQIRVLTGFDRVMVYRFDESGAGEVIAEAATNGMDTFLGLQIYRCRHVRCICAMPFG
jgi:light-regulated signal transduction histidine kinase (bacteriophytochrome)